MRHIFLLLFIMLLVACHDNHSQYNGYIDADLTYLSSNFSGRLTHLLVHRGQEVQKNQPVFQLESANQSFHLRSSELTQKNLLSQRRAILSQRHYAEINYRRTLDMKQQHAASQNDVDLAKRDQDVLQAQQEAIDFQIESNKTDIHDNRWQLQRKAGYASDAGLIFDTYFTQSEYVAAGLPVVSLITKEHIKVIFFVPENELHALKLNQKITLLNDGSPTKRYGFIRYISRIAQYTSQF